jgi:uncharacterized membrane protein
MHAQPSIAPREELASGALGGALTDVDINDAFMKKLSASLQPGNAVI